MTATDQHARRSPLRFFVCFALVALVVAGLVSYLASSAPDGLDAATLRGCEVVDTDGAETLTGECIATNAADHPFATGPLADYTVGGNEGLSGISGVIGVLVTLLVAGGLFLLVRPRGRRPNG